MYSFLLDFSEFTSIRAKWARSGNSVHRSVITLPFGDRSGAAGHDGARKVCAYQAPTDNAVQIVIANGRWHATERPQT